jgi:primosomal protein N' (replication factor Y) (superfamily II helicase)
VSESCVLFAKVIVDTPGLGALDYAVPNDMLVAVGDRVAVGLRTRTVVGIVVKLLNASDYTGPRLRRIKAVLRETPPLREEWLALTHFAARYYVRGWGEAAVPALPQFFRRMPGVRFASQLEKIRALPEKSGGEPAEPPVLNEGQRAAVDAICSAKGFATFLLFGVTGSGKTEVYLHAMEKTLAADPEAQVLLLVPEINLTPQLEARVRDRFPNENVVSMHSEFSQTERARSWLAVHEGRARVLVGTRMAVFSSFKKLSLILVDEEHDASYKAGDGLRFSARDLAVWRAARNGVPAVLGSATPSIESWVKAKSGDYRLLRLPERAVHDAKLPEISLIDPAPRGSGVSLSETAAQAIDETLAAGRQALVFINRRGYAPVVSCPACGWVSMCPRCSAFTVFHKVARKLVCHHCGWQTDVPEACPICGNPDIIPRGTGTERIEEELERRFPGRKILRIDRDSVSRKHEAERAFEKVHRGEVDILVGTQMIAKGHDFPNIGLVTVLNADAQILSPDMRARERLFATLTQVAGRAGRRGDAGRVLIQTRFADDPFFGYLKRQDYEGFADALAAERRENSSVPFVHQALLTAQAKTVSEALYFLEAAAKKGMALAPESVRVFDPVPMPLVRLMNVERAQLLIEADSRSDLNRFLWSWTAALRTPSGIDWSIEVDPASV